MNPIISPFIIYLIDVLYSIQVLAILCLIFLLCSPLFVICWADIAKTDRVERVFKKLKSWYIGLGIFIIIGLVFIPDKNTLLTMLVVSYITPDNINLVEGHIIDFVSNIMQTVKEINR